MIPGVSVSFAKVLGVSARLREVPGVCGSVWEISDLVGGKMCDAGLHRRSRCRHRALPYSLALDGKQGPLNRPPNQA